jgi:hypothetical protein
MAGFVRRARINNMPGGTSHPRGQRLRLAVQGRPADSRTQVRWEQGMAKKVTSDKADGHMTLEPLNEPRTPAPRSGPSRNEVERRTRTERRLVYDRRELIRFEDDRRAYRDRRVGSDPWAIP